MQSTIERLLLLASFSLLLGALACVPPDRTDYSPDDLVDDSGGTNLPSPADDDDDDDTGGSGTVTDDDDDDDTSTTDPGTFFLCAATPLSKMKETCTVDSGW